MTQKWKDKYIVEWCDLCETACITCPDCNNSSCNGSGCEKCSQDWDDWFKTRHLLDHYLHQQETLIYTKCRQLKKLILESLNRGESEINWTDLVKNGELSTFDEFLFKSLIDEHSRSKGSQNEVSGLGLSRETVL